MDLLKRRILRDGVTIGKDIIKVDSFLNHQLDIGLFMALCKEIHSRFGHLGINKLLTIESAGIAIASVASRYFDLAPVVFAKKSLPNTMSGEFYTAEAKSFTKGEEYTAYISKEFLRPEDKILIIDDFLAHGDSAMALCSLAEQAGATVCGITSIIEKEYQGGSKRLREAGYYVNSLAVITKIRDGEIIFKDDEPSSFF